MTSLESFFEERLAQLSAVFRPDRVFMGVLFILGVISISLLYQNVFPLSVSYAVFYFFLIVLLGLYRPAFLWQAVVFLLPFEILVFASGAGVELRLYQVGILALLLANGILWLQKKITFPIARWFDGALFLLFVGAVLAFVTRSIPPLESVKQLLILASFGALYFLGRVFLKTKESVGVFFHTLIVSGAVVAGYGLYQTLALRFSWPHLMVMSGRPNSVFQEADWLGFFLGLVLLVSFVDFLKKEKVRELSLHACLLFLFSVVMMLTVSRSAWLAVVVGVASIMIILCGGHIFGFFGAEENAKQKKQNLLLKVLVGPVVIVGLVIFTVSFFQLTRFDLTERFSSAGTGEQVITVACAQGKMVPERINEIADLAAFECQHINLEEKEKYQQEGRNIQTTLRPDPNIAIRQSIYKQSFAILKEQFLFGIGWGQSLTVFGTDARGAGLNSSNMFLEIWLGSGLLGILGFLVFWFGVLVAALGRLFHKREVTEGFWITILVISMWVQVTLFNLFNAGLLLGTCIAVLFFFGWYLEKTCPRIYMLWRK